MDWKLNKYDLNEKVRLCLAMLPCLALVVVVIAFHFLRNNLTASNAAISPELRNKRNSFRFSKCTDKVAFHLMYDRTHVLRYPHAIAHFTNTEPDLRRKIPLIIAMKDGSLLYNNVSGREVGGPASYVLGKVEATEIENIQEFIWKTFGLSESAAHAPAVVPVDSPFHVLGAQHKGHFLTFIAYMLGGKYDNGFYSDKEIAIDGACTKTGLPIYGPEFYKKLKTVKEKILNLGKSIVDKEDTISVDVTFENDLLTVFNKEGDTLLELDFSPVETGEKANVE